MMKEEHSCVREKCEQTHTVRNHKAYSKHRNKELSRLLGARSAVKGRLGREVCRCMCVCNGRPTFEKLI